ncbi:MAG: sensor histidine kinase [Candidatus Kapabacteria bacterium]|jgi:sensor histidine kinase YesM|nr:sensor histidine kinase [Candidatus Kapabacteria bacterium]
MKKSVIIYIHIFFWIALLATNFIAPVLARHLSPKEFGIISTYVKLSQPVFFYVGYLLIMKIKWNRKFLLYTIIGIVTSYLILFIFSKKAFAFGLAPLSSIFLWTTIGSLFRLFIDWFKKKNDILVLEKENISSNLALLKNQINPHFLFNTLHNIDTLIHDNQDKASKSLVKLSDIMRYMLKDSKSEFVDLQNEIVYLENYFSLERLRLKNENFFNYSISGSYKGFKIAPMILIPFIENAFKHSVDSSIENGIIVKISINNSKLVFNCENQYDKAETDKDKTQGIGLETVQKRLDLIYNNKYKMIINSENSIFKVNLELELNEN